jgi:hypothetical protein
MPADVDKPRLGVGTTLLLLLPLPVLALGLYLVIGGYFVDNLKELREQTPIAAFEFDLSQPSEVTVAVLHEHSTPFGVVLKLKMDPPVATQGELDELLAGLSGEVVVKDAAGVVVDTQPLGELGYPLADGEIGFAQFLRLQYREGRYTVTIQVDSGAPALADADYTIESFNSIGYYPLLYEAVGRFGLMVLAVGGLPFACGVVGLVRHRRAK